MVSRASRSHPVSWGTLKDLLYLRECFFGSENRFQEGVAKVRAFSTKGHIPHPIEATSFLYAALGSDDGMVDPYVVRLSLSMAIIRFVNGYVDKNKDANSSRAVYHVARRLGMPSHFVELRHAATHDSLPSLELLRICVQDALSWLWNHYWVSIESTEVSTAIEAQSSVVKRKKTPEQEKKSREVLQGKIKQQFKTWRRVRKDDVDAEIDLQDESVLNTVNTLGSYLEGQEDVFFDVIINKNIMVPKSDIPVERMAALYGPLLNQHAQSSLVFRLLVKIIELVNETEEEIYFDSLQEVPTLSEEVREEKEQSCACLKYWVQYFFQERDTPSLENPWFDDITEAMKYLILHPRPWFTAVFKAYVENEESNATENEILVMNDSMHVLSESGAERRQKPDIEEIEEELNGFKRNLEEEFEREEDRKKRRLQQGQLDKKTGTYGWILQES